MTLSFKVSFAAFPKTFSRQYANYYWLRKSES
jgi:hypothetical protein